MFEHDTSYLKTSSGSAYGLGKFRKLNSSDFEREIRLLASDSTLVSRKGVINNKNFARTKKKNT